MQNSYFIYEITPLDFIIFFLMNPLLKFNKLKPYLIKFKLKSKL